MCPLPGSRLARTPICFYSDAKREFNIGDAVRLRKQREWVRMIVILHPITMNGVPAVDCLWHDKEMHPHGEAPYRRA